jgi:hypothetical protein
MRKPIAASIWLILAVCGCGNQNLYFGTPDLLHPGTLARQRWRAEVFDPYPVPYLGTPVEGARPLQYKTPAPEAEDHLGDLKTRFGPPPPKYWLQPEFFWNGRITGGG